MPVDGRRQLPYAGAGYAGIRTAVIGFWDMVAEEWPSWVGSGLALMPATTASAGGRKAIARWAASPPGSVPAIPLTQSEIPHPTSPFRAPGVVDS